jgi:hypothetical protein
VEPLAACPVWSKVRARHVLWDGKPGDNPGGTEHMVELVRKLTGRQPVLIDPTTL